MRRSSGQTQENIPRVRLLEKLAGAPRIVHIRAPAGFGKSILLDQFEAELIRADRRPVRIDLTTPANCRRDADHPGGFDDATILIDNADCLAASPETRKLLDGLIRDSASRIVLASRGEIELSLARHEASGGMLSIGPHAMLFDNKEQAAVLEHLGASGFSPQQVELVFESFAGWPLGLALQTRVALQGFRPEEFSSGDLAARIVKGTWRLLDDYFEQEVTTALPPEISAFLVRASILETLRVKDCRGLFGGDEGEFLHRAYRAGAPLWPLDPEHSSYMILPVFRQFLRARLNEEDANVLGGKACELLEQRKDYSGASLLALEFGDHARAARLIERQMRADFGLRDETRLLTLAERIDADVRNRHPRILLAQSQSLIFRFEFEQARWLLEKARARVEEMALEEADEPGEIRTLEMLVLHREMVLALGQHDLSVGQDHGTKLLSGLEDVPPMQRVMLLSLLIYAQQELYIFRGAERYYAQAKKLVPALESWIWSIPLETFYARYLLQTGRTATAIGILEAILTRLSDELGPRSMLGAIAAIALAEMKFEVGAVDEAEELLKDYADNIEHFGFLSLIIAARVTQARVHMARGEFDAGFAVLERPAISVGELFDKLSHSLNVERIYWLLRLAREGAPRLASSTTGLSLTRAPDPHSSAGAAEEAYATAWIQLARAGRRIEEAIQVAQKWQRYTEGVGAIRSNVRWHIILASLRILVEEPGLAMRHLRRAVKLGAGGEYRSAFLTESDVLHEQLVILADSDLEESEKAFVRSIIGLPRKPPSTGDTIDLPLPLGAFSSREIAILRLVAKGQMNREIGATLGMTEGTVKWYLHKIYDMLGIRRRSQVAMLISQWHMRAIERGEDSPFENDDYD